MDWRKTKLYEDEFTPKYPEVFEELDYNKIPFLTKRQIRSKGFNTHISEEKYFLLPKNLRDKWYRLDLTWLDVEPPKFPTKDPISQMTETPPDIFQLVKDTEKRIKLKAMILGELTEKSEE